MRRSFTLTVPAVAAAAAVALATAAGPAGAAAPPTANERPTKVVVILVDALSKEIVDKYDMGNVKGLMDDYVDTPRGYLGHVGSVTVVTHNVLTTGLLPKNMGWSDDGYRDTTNLLGGTNPFWIPSSWSRDDMFTVQESIGKRRLPDYLKAADPTAKTFVVSPKGYAAWAFGGPTADSIITFGSNTNCDGTTRRGPAGVNVPAYVSEPCGRYFVKRSSSLTYDTHQWPASLYPLDGNRYATGHEEDHLGGDIWATDIALDIMDNEEWNGIFLSLPDVDKNAHMWGSVDDAEGAGLVDPDPMTHMEFAAKTADEQVGRVMDKLRADGELDNTIVVLTADHGSVPGRDFHGTVNTALNYGFYNWYYGTAANDAPYLQPQDALKPLTDTDNVGLSYSDSMLRVWLKDTSPAKVSEAASLMAGMPGVSAVWTRAGDRYTRVSPIRYGRMTTPGEKAWFVRHAQELVDTEAAVYGPEVIATLVDDTTYSVAGDHGGIQRRSQEIPIVFAGADLSRTDLQAPVRSVDVMPMLLRHMGITVDPGLDGVGYTLPTRP